MNYRVVLITGANRGIGRGFATAYLAIPNTTVIATVRDVSAQNASELSSLPKAQNSRLIVAELSLDAPSTVTEAISKVIKQHHMDHIDIVIANAGICNHWGPVSEIEDADMTSHLEVNTLGPLRLFRATAPLLKASKHPKFVYLSSELASIASLEQSLSLTTAYGVSKAASNYMVKKIHEENEGLIAFSIDPGFVQSDMGSRGARYGGLPEAPMTINESVEGIIGQIECATKTTTSGKFIRFNGDTLPW
ncbi:hypothetical protein ASPWEDRAFT_59207 [Aspergillus wentii DTO 134E9]|uniref:Uncharacterized protein n=1 Tax=Aspergillus wentii DTO 134E9 TaxID=1073089 RepID=A0A1L9RSI9_ASPWE|nr:uncharacterized protein ASPWEDRAFT_59207 [Aspergillus wentii DTO 134E9]OJJ37892.1 hypothetical protein ASPWEDRAFT_59207 [Aspergillus wentii DTO 134E9]